MNDGIIEIENSWEGGIDTRPGFAITWEGEGPVDVLLLAARSLEDHDPPMALQFIEAAMELAPDGLSSYLEAGRLALRHHKVHEAISWFEKGLEIAPNEAVFYDNLSRAYYEANDLNKAILFVDKVLQFQPKDLGACLRKIRWLAESNRWMELDEFFKDHQSTVHEAGEARLWRCLAVVHLGRIDEARLLFEQATLKSKRQHPKIARQIAPIIGDSYRKW